MSSSKPKKFWLRPSDKQELIEYLPRLERLLQRAVQNRLPWARCYQAELKMIKSGLATGRM